MTDERPDNTDSEPQITTPIDPDEQPAVAVITTVSTLTNTPPDALEPLYTVLDPDALNEAVAASPTVSVSFEYTGCLVTVTRDSVQVQHTGDD